MAPRIGKAGVLLLICMLAVSSLAYAVTYPRYEGYVNDFARVISTQDRRAIEETASSLKQGGNIELAVVTVRSLDGLGVEEYAIGLAEAWGVGTSAEDLGVILLLAVDDRRIRIEVGYGLEGDLPDGLAGSLLDTHVIPDLRQNNYSQALVKGSSALASLLAQRRGFDLPRTAAVQTQSSQESELPSFLYVLIILFVIFGRLRLWPLLFWGSMVRRPRGGGFGTMPRGGGFGGFGGGRFGGGGASRSF